MTSDSSSEEKDTGDEPTESGAEEDGDVSITFDQVDDEDESDDEGDVDDEERRSGDVA